MAVEISHDIIIDAPISLAWDVLTDFRRYSEWNPFVVDIEGPARPGPSSLLTLVVNIPGQRQTRAPDRVVELAAPGPGGSARLSWAYAGRLGFLGGIRARRQQSLEDLGDGRTRYRNREKIEGWLSGFTSEEALKEGFEDSVEAFKARCEALA